MLRVEGREPGALFARIRDHAHGIEAIATELWREISAIDGWILRDSAVHVVAQSGTGAESWGLYLADGRQFHFRVVEGHASTDIIVRDSYRSGAEIAELTDPGDAIRFIRSLNPVRSPALV